MSTSPKHSGLRLSKRLYAAAMAVREGCRAADVGCDHGKLAAWLVLSGRCGFVLAVDASAASLKKASDLFCRLGIEDRTKAVLSDSLNNFESFAVDDVVIAGLGYDCSARIIIDAGWLKDPKKQLVLVPSSRHPQMRRFLYAEGFEIVSERAVFEAGKIYTVITARFCGVSAKISAAPAAVGGIPGSGGDEARYLAAVRLKNERMIKELKRSAAGGPGIRDAGSEIRDAGSEIRDAESGIREVESKIRDAEEILFYIDSLMPQSGAADGGL